MSEPNFVLVDKPGAVSASSKRATAKTAIKFPYQDLNSAVTVAKKIFEKGGRSGETAQVAAWLGHETVDSGAFRSRTGAAQTFGLISTRPGTIELTGLGSQIVDPQTEKAARVEAFLTVPLYKAIYETFKSGMLPKDVGLESEMERLGVPPKQTDTARQIFARSAKQAGFFDEGDERLVKPVVAKLDVITPEVTQILPPEPEKRNADVQLKGGSGGGPTGGESKTIRLFGGGSLTLHASVSFFNMPRRDRDFVFELIDKLTEYETVPMIEAPKREPVFGISEETAEFLKGVPISTDDLVDGRDEDGDDEA